MCSVVEALTKSKHAKATEFLERAITLLEQQLVENWKLYPWHLPQITFYRKHYKLMILLKVLTKSKHPRASEFLEKAIHNAKKAPSDFMQIQGFESLVLLMISINHPDAIDFVQRYLNPLRIKEKFDVPLCYRREIHVYMHKALCKVCEALAIANHPRTDELFQLAIESANQLEGATKHKFQAFHALAEAMAVKNPSEAFNMMQHAIDILMTMKSLKNDYWVLSDINRSFEKILSQVGKQLHNGVYWARHSP